MSIHKDFVIYTAITGKYDTLREPKIKSDQFDYIVFTDNEDLSVNVWNPVLIPHSSLEEAKKARYYKIMPHIHLSKYKFSIWIDGNMEIIGDMYKLLQEAFSNPFVTIGHPHRDCIFQEAQACKKYSKDTSEIIDVQINRYRLLGYPLRNGLIASGVLIREHNNHLVKKTMEDWWKEISRFSKRDQLSFNYVASKNGLRYKELSYDHIFKEYLLLHPHTSKSK